MSRHIYTLKKPASWHKEMWREALPLGNGLTGVLIPGCIAEEKIHFNRHDLWEGGSNSPLPDITDAFRTMRDAIDRGDYQAANKDNLWHALQEKGYATGCDWPHPLGWLHMNFTPSAMFKGYRRGVNMRTGEAFVAFSVDGCHYRRTAFVSRACDTTVMRMTADRPFTVSYQFKLYNKQDTCAVTENGIRCASENGYTEANIRFAGDFTATISEDTLTVTGSDYTVYIRCASHGSDCSLEGIADKTYGELLAAHTALHTPLYDAVSIELAPDGDFDATNEQMLEEAYDNEASPALLERLWRFGRYLFISAASENGNPVPLYGLWHGTDRLPWCQYVANENVEMTYWHTMAGGLSYAVLPLLRYYTAKLDYFRECARQIFGMRGIWVSAYTTPNASGACVPVYIIINWISCAGWLCRHFWEYYLYTGDKTLLREEILPFMYEAALFYRDYVTEENGTLRIYPSLSPENSPATLRNATTGACGAVVQNATMDFAIMKELLTNLLTGMEITGLYADDAASFRELLAKIPAYHINEDGAVKEWMHPDIGDNYHHRHLSHIYPVFPGNEVTAHNDPALFEAFKRAVMLRKLGSQSGWSLTHMANIYARMGEAERALNCLDIMAKGVVMSSLLTTHNDWRDMGITLTWNGDCTEQLDANFGAVNALQEMLFCWQKEALSVLPALPARLADGSARGLVFPEGTLDIAWEADGKVTVTVRASRDVDTDILLRGEKITHLTLSAGESRIIYSE